MTSPPVRSRPWLVALAWGLGLLGVAQALGTALFSAEAAAGSTEVGVIGYFFFISLASICAYSLVGAALAARRPRHYAGWTLVAGGVLFGLALMSYTYGTAGLRLTPPRAGSALALWLGDWLFLPALAGTGMLFLLHFPTGHLPGPRWVWVRRATVLVLALAVAAEAFHPGAINPDDPPGATNPFGAPASVTWLFDALGLVANVAIVVLMSLVALALVQRYRVANDTVRHQIKWIAYVGAGIAIAAPLAAAQVGVLSEWAWLATLTFIGLVPLAVAFAVLRYRLYDIDTLINRTIVYGGLTAILAGLYTASIRLFNGLFVAATGEESEAALVITTLILASTLTPIRRWLEGIVQGRSAERTTPEPPAESAALLADPAFDERLRQMVDASVERAVRRASSPRRAPRGR